jgi:hypothetical protein
MKSRWNSFLLVAAAFLLFGCQITIDAPAVQNQPSQPYVQPTAYIPPTEYRPAPEAIPGLAGTWQYFGSTGTLYYNIDIVWDDQGYYVENCIGFNDVVCEIESQYWDGYNFEWTNYFPNTDYHTKHTVLSVEGDVLTTSREGTGGVGTTVYQRKP